MVRGGRVISLLLLRSSHCAYTVDESIESGRSSSGNYCELANLSSSSSSVSRRLEAIYPNLYSLFGVRVRVRKIPHKKHNHCRKTDELKYRRSVNEKRATEHGQNTHTHTHKARAFCCSTSLVQALTFVVTRQQWLLLVAGAHTIPGIPGRRRLLQTTSPTGAELPASGGRQT